MEDHSRGKVTAAGLGGRGVVDQARIEGEPGTADEDGALPTGRQLELRRGGVSAVVTEVGATLRALEVGGLSILQLPLDEPDRTNAMHGLVRWLNWAPLSSTPSRLVMGLVLHARDGYPFVLSLRVAYTLTPSGLRVRQSARNLGAVPAPYGAGFHPYLTVGTPRIDECILRLPARTSFLVNARMIPTGRAGVAGTPLDFREPRAIGDSVMDTGFTDLERDADGLARVELAAPSGRPRLSVLLDRGYPFLQVFTGDGLPD